ncbi:unnamed protein product, partial [Laminaria digitata]
MDAAGDLAGNAAEAAGDLAGDVGDLAGDVGETVGYAGFDAIEAARDAVDTAGAFAEDAFGEDAEDVDMYAGAGPMDLDDGGPTGGGATPKVLSGPRRLVKAFSY